MPILDFATFRSHFDKIVQKEVTSWEAVGFIAPGGTVYAFGTDSKVISTIFESISAPIIQQIAKQFEYVVESSPQTIYPDFTLSPEPIVLSGPHSRRIAIDIKTTYRKLTAQMLVKKFNYTLGSYTSFLRSPAAKKNIRYPYAEYSDHWVIGFLYTRREGVPAKVYHKPDPSKILCPYHDVEYFIQEKFKIVGTSPGSGNTTNIGSFATSDIDDLRQGKGPFSEHGKEVCDNYWRHYGRTAKDRKYSTIQEFLAWLKKPEGS